jgi:DNA-binding transcriptional MerR regulator
MLRIGELARLAGVTPRLLRHYEAIGVLAPAVTNSRTGYRYYDRAQVITLQQILAYRDAGVPLAIIAELSQMPEMLLQRQREALETRRAELDRQSASLNAMTSRPFRVKRTAPFWAASIRRSVTTYQAADDLLREFRADAAVWHECRPDEGRIDCEMQVMFRHPGKGLRPVPSQLVASFAHTGPDTELPAIYREIQQWSRAARYRVCGPLREVYWNGVTDVQFPVC